MGELTLFGAAANTAGFEAAIHMVRIFLVSLLGVLQGAGVATRRAPSPRSM